MAGRSQYPTTIYELIARRLAKIFGTKSLYSEPVDSEGDRLAQGRRSVFLRHLDCGSCNGCELELSALANPIYDSERFGIKFEASPRHADALVLTGIYGRNLAEAADLTLSAMSEPRRVVAVGDCAIDGGIFRAGYAAASRSAAVENAIVAEVPGCPPTPAQILAALARVAW